MSCVYSCASFGRRKETKYEVWDYFPTENEAWNEVKTLWATGLLATAPVLYGDVWQVLTPVESVEG